MLIVDAEFPYVHWLTQNEVFERAFKEATDKELQLVKLTAPELVSHYYDAKVKSDDAECMLIEHCLNLRLTLIQAKATMSAGYIGLIGAVLAGVLGFVLGKL